MTTQRVEDALEIGRLATLSPFEYEREREAVAKKLGVRPRALDKSVAEARLAAGRANGHDPNANAIPGGLPIIPVVRGERHLAAGAGARAMLDAGCEVYVRGAKLVRVALLSGKSATGEEMLTAGLLPVTHAALGRMLGMTALWEKLNWKGEVQRIDPPVEVAEQLLEMAGEWPFAPLNGIITCPTLRPDGSLLTTPGYDPATGLFLTHALTLPEIPVTPTKDQAQTALQLLGGLLEEFPFADAASKSVAYSQLITPVVRAAVGPVVPLHLVRAPHSGTGKSYLADLAALIATGQPCPVIAADENLDETEKRLIGAVMAGRPIINLDNCTGTLKGSVLCQIIERPMLELRKLGASDMPLIVNAVTVFANGNNLIIVDDVARRVIICNLDADIENPETRIFKTDPAALIRADRGQYIAAALIIVRAYLAAGCPDCLSPLPSFAAWSNLVRSALVWLGCADPVGTMEGARVDDPVRQDRLQVFSAWVDELGINQQYQTRELIEKAMEDTTIGFTITPRHAQLRAALLAVAGKRTNPSQLDVLRLGQWLARNVNTIAGDFKLLVDRRDRARPRWSVEAR